MVIIGHMLCYQPFWMAAMSKNLTNDYYGSMVKNRDLQQRLSITKFGSIFNVNMLSAILSAILNSSHYQKSQK